MATHSSILAWEAHRQRSLVGHSPWGCKESDMTEATEHAHAYLLRVEYLHRDGNSYIHMCNTRNKANAL